MYKSVHFDGSRLLVDKNYLRKHDIHYFSPAYQGYDGFPLGDGDTAYMIWNTRRSIIFHINKSDAIDFVPDGRFKAWSWESEEKHTAQVHCGQISISDGMPSFDLLYLKEFDECLDIQNGRITLHSMTPFSSWDCSVIASHDRKVLIVKVKSESPERVARKIRLEAWGSRSFYHFYEQIVQDPSKRLNDTEAGKKNGCIYIKRRLKDVCAVSCIKVVGCEFEPEVLNHHTAELTLSKSKATAFTLICSTVVSQNRDLDPVEEAMSRVNTAFLNIDSIEAEHEKYWRAFWDKSFVHLDDDYLENLYYLHLYSLNCCSRGKYPVNALGGAWTWNSDVRNWGHFYHWNGQQTFWGLDASNHAELLENYYDYRFNMLKNAERDAQEVFGIDGALYSDISNYNGYQAIEPDTVRNLTVGPEIALDFYRHYQYTTDFGFLKNRVYPIMKACVSFYCGLLKKTDGRYHISDGSTSYESYWNLKDSITDYCIIKTLFPAFLEARRILGINDAKKSNYADIIENLFEMPTTCVTFPNGDQKTILSAGVKWNGDAVGMGEGTYPWSPFPACQLVSIFPSGLIGLKDIGTKYYNLAIHTVRFILDMEFYKSGEMGCSGHTPIPQVVARLGMKADMIPILKSFVQKYQAFPNGFMHYLDNRVDNFKDGTYYTRLLGVNENSTAWDRVHEKSEGSRINLSKNDFIHMYYEPSSNLFCGINEMLLQSYDGVIRVFPAVPEDYTAAFTLKAQGNFLVTSEIFHGEIMYIALKSIGDGVCAIEMPWNCKIKIENGKKEIPYVKKGKIIRFKAISGQVYLVERCEYPLNMYYTNIISANKNSEIKKLGSAILGKERQF